MRAPGSRDGLVEAIQRRETRAPTAADQDGFQLHASDAAPIPQAERDLVNRLAPAPGDVFRGNLIERDRLLFDGVDHEKNSES